MVVKNCTRDFYSHSRDIGQFAMNSENHVSMIVSTREIDLSGIEYSLQHTRWFLRFLGIWPLVASRPSQFDKYLAKFLLPISTISMIILTIPILTHVVLNIDNRLDLLVLSDSITFQTTNIVNHFIMILRSSTIKRCIEHMEVDWQRIDDHTDYDIMMKHLRVGRGITVVCACCMYGGTVSYFAIMPLCAGNTINEFNETVRPLIYPGAENFVNLQYGRNYEIVFFSNFLSGFFHFSVVTVVCNLSAIFVCHACGQIEIVIAKLERLVDNEINDVTTAENRIRLIIQYHTRVLRFSSRIDDLFRAIFLMAVGASTTILCIIGYYCILKWYSDERVAALTYILLLMSEIFNIYIFCHIGELLKKQLAQVGQASYLIEWYRLPGKTGLSLVLLNAMANYPRKLTAGGMMELSIASFATIMKTAMGYLNMIRTTTE